MHQHESPVRDRRWYDSAVPFRTFCLDASFAWEVEVEVYKTFL